MKKILKAFGFTEEPLSIVPFCSDEDGSAYNVWKVEYPHKTYVLKAAKGDELFIYNTYLQDKSVFAPALCGVARDQEKEYLLMEYISGEDLRRCDRKKLTAVLDSLIAMQSAFWDEKLPENALNSRKNRYNFLLDPLLETVYQAYLSDCQEIPATLCHDDLLPFNLLISNDRCVFIDWEVGGILPYPASLARLIAHTEACPDAFFYMSEDDKLFAIDYYYEKLLANRGVAYKEYRRSLDLALFYEYCEWVFVGNRYNTSDSPRFAKYVKLARNKAKELGYS